MPEQDEGALVAALTRLLEDEAFAAACRANLEAAACELTWERAFAPLVRFLQQPGGPEAVGEPRSSRRAAIAAAAAAYGTARGREKAAARLRL